MILQKDIFARVRAYTYTWGDGGVAYTLLEKRRKNLTLTSGFLKNGLAGFYNSSIAVISGLTCKRDEMINSALY